MSEPKNIDEKTFLLTAWFGVCINVILYLSLNLCLCAVMEVKRAHMHTTHELLRSREDGFGIRPCDIII